MKSVLAIVLYKLLNTGVTGGGGGGVTGMAMHHGNKSILNCGPLLDSHAPCKI